MLIIMGEFTVDPAERDQFLRDRVATMENSRAENGCQEYAMAADPVVPGRVVLAERWETQEALDAHMVALRAGNASPGSVKTLSMTMSLYEVGKVTKLI
jgi:quinol monooxygenase YgiN